MLHSNLTMELLSIVLLQAWICGYNSINVKDVHWIEHTGSCYYLHNTNVTYPEAEMTCRNISTDAQLSELNAAGELLAVNQILGAGSRQYWVSTIKLSGSFAAYKWTTAGSAPEAWMWMENEPNNSGNCVRLIRYTDYTVIGIGNSIQTIDPGLFYLADNNCYATISVLCEKPSSVTSSYSRRLMSLPSKLCGVATFVTSGLKECALYCARSTSCYVYGYQTEGKLCSFHVLLNQCGSGQTVTNSSSTVKYFQIARHCG